MGRRCGWEGSGRLTRLDPGEGGGSSALEREEVGCCAKRSVGWRLVGSGQSQEVGFRAGGGGLSRLRYGL